MGQKLGLTLLIDFSDAVATIPQAEILNFCNGDSYTGYGNNGSVKKYYLDNSNGRLTYSNLVTIYIRVPQPKTYYNNTAIDCGIQGRLLITDAINAMKALTNYTTDILPTFANLTVDGSSQVVACNVFFAGANSGVWSFGLWPHSWVLASPVDLGNGKRVYKYQITNIGNSLTTGTFCHENGHMLCGFPDIYDYDYDSYGGAGSFCLMGYGGSGGNPVQICAYLKRAAGWATTIELTSSSALTASVSSSGADFNKFYRYAKPGVSTEYFLVENRQRVGRDANLPAAGIAVWHVDELGDRDNQSTNFNTSHLNYEVSLMQADNLWQFQSYVNSGDSRDLYYLGNTATGYANRFSDSTSPSARWWDGSASGVILHHFSASGTTMTFGVGPDWPVVTLDSASLIAEGCSPTNAAIDAYETVTVNFALKNTGGGNTVNLVATLLASDGVISPSSPQTYGVLLPNGTAVARPFSFTAAGTCGGLLSTVLQLQDGTNNLGTVTNTFTLGAVGAPALTTYSSGGVAVPIPDKATVDVPISIADDGTVTDVNVRVRLDHTRDSDLVISLVHPDGTVITLANKRGSRDANYGSGAADCSGVFTVFDDAASTPISSGSAPFAGAYQPDELLSTLNGKPLAGTWTLRVADTAQKQIGTIYCFQLDITRQTLACCVGASSDLALLMSDGPDPVTVGSNLTYNLTVTNLGPQTASNVTISDTLPAGVVFTSAGVSQGTWATNGAGLFTCVLGDVSANGSASVSILVRSSSAGSISNSASVSSSVSDPNLANNTAIAVTTANEMPPQITQQPQPQNACPGATATFTVTATGAGPLAYQWQKDAISLTNGATYGGVTTSNLMVAGVDSTVLGDYRCVVSNPGGSTPSSEAALTINDPTPPTIICPPDTTVSTDAGTCTATNVDLGTPVTGDNCGVASVTNNRPPIYALGTNLVIWTVTDTSGNTNSCHQQVIVVDTQPPTISWYMTNVVVGADTNCQAAIPDITSTNYILAVDNCSSITVTQSVAADTVVALGTNEVVLAAFDAAGNVAYCTNYVLVVDLTPPQLVSAANKTVECGSAWSFDPPVASDICSGTNVAVTLLEVVSNGICPEVFTATWVAVDAYGNTNTCSQSVTQVDTTPPVLTCAGDKTVEFGIPLNFDTPVASDTCSGTNVTITLVSMVTNGTSPEVVTATWLASDPCGNTNTCCQSITNVVTAPPISLSFGPPEWLPDVGLKLSLLGNFTGSVTIQWTEELTNVASNWPTLIWFSNFIGSTQYIDPIGTNVGRRFYRAVTP